MWGNGRGFNLHVSEVSEAIPVLEGSIWNYKSGIRKTSKPGCKALCIGVCRGGGKPWMHPDCNPLVIAKRWQSVSPPTLYRMERGINESIRKEKSIRQTRLLRNMKRSGNPGGSQKGYPS